MRLDPTITRYINFAIKQERQIFKKDLKATEQEIKCHNSALAGHFDHTIKTVIEIANARPTEERVREIVREEIKN